MEATLLNIVRQAAVELGLTPSKVVASSLDAQAHQMHALLNMAGNDIVSEYKWQALMKKYSTPLVSGQAEYDLPPDLESISDKTIWVNGWLYPAYGSMSNVQTQYLDNTVYGLINRTYTIRGGKLIVYPTPGSDGSINYIYKSNGWIQSFTDPTVYTDMFTNDGDVAIFNFWLLVAALKLKMWEAKGLDTTTLAANYARALALQQSADKPAPNLSLAACATSIGTPQVPDQGIGQ